MLRRLSLGLGIVALLAATPDPAWAQDADAMTPEQATERARALFQEGLGLADDGDWQRAVHRFRQALALREAAPVRYNLAISLHRMGRLTEAIEELDRVLAQPDADQQVRASVLGLRRELSGRLGHLTVEVRGELDGAHVTVDGRPWEWIGEPALADPGIRVVRLLRAMQELDVQEADVPDGGDARVVLEAPGSAVASGDDGWIWGLVIGLAAAAVGAGVAVGIVLGTAAQPSMGDFGPPLLEVD